MTDDQVWHQVNVWLRAATGITVIRGWQGGRRPARPYVMSNFTGSAAIRAHEQEVEYAEDAPSERIMARPVIETEWRFSLHAYSETPSDILRPLRARAVLAQPNEPLMPGLIIHELSQIRNIPDFQNEDWEPRAQMDFNVRGLVRDGALIDTIEEVTFDINEFSTAVLRRP